VSILIINVVVPLLHAYGQTFGDNKRMGRAIDIIQSLKPEHNSIITLFNAAGIDCPDAMTSQALIELRNEYCLARKCLYCRIGHRLLAAKVKP
jgi:succinyl-CoA synthetase alpha subunit